MPLEFREVDSEGGKKLLARWGKGSDRLPVVILFDRQALVDPTNEDMVDAFARASRSG